MTPLERLRSALAQGGIKGSRGHFEIDGIRFDLDYSDTMGAERQAGAGLSFRLGKTPDMIERLCQILSGESVRQICEFGIFEGGSTALYDLLFDAPAIACFDWDKERAPDLDRYIAERGAAGRIKPFYGVDQADRTRVRELLRQSFADTAVDLVIDDASHHLEPTRTAFNITFPLLRPFGWYVIEDWAWAHWPGDTWQKDGGKYPDRPAPTNLVIELLQVAASRPDVIYDMIIDRNAVFIRRGVATLPLYHFELRTLVLNRGRRFFEMHAPPLAAEIAEAEAWRPLTESASAIADVTEVACGVWRRAGGEDLYLIQQDGQFLFLVACLFDAGGAPVFLTGRLEAIAPTVFAGRLEAPSGGPRHGPRGLGPGQEGPALTILGEARLHLTGPGAGEIQWPGAPRAVARDPAARLSGAAGWYWDAAWPGWGVFLWPEAERPMIILCHYDAETGAATWARGVGVWAEGDILDIVLERPRGATTLEGLGPDAAPPDAAPPDAAPPDAAPEVWTRAAFRRRDGGAVLSGDGLPDLTLTPYGVAIT